MGGRADAAAARSHRHVPLFESASDGPGVHREAPTDGGPGFASVVGRFGFVELGLGQDWLSWPLSLDPPFVDWWTLFGFNTGGGPCRAWCVGAGACRGSGWWVVGGLSTAGLSGVRQVLV